MALETELKLMLDPRHIARLRQHPLFKKSTSTVTHKLHSIYYDTEKLDLALAGVALRLRRSGARWIQTVKGGGSVTAGLHQREEIEAEVAAPFPDFSLLGETSLARYFASPRLRARLKPMMITEFTRTSFLLKPVPGVVIEASIDRGVIKSGDLTEPLCELELEVKQGSPSQVYPIAQQLLGTVPLLIEQRSKAERGFALHRAVPPTPRKAAPGMLTPQMSSQQAFTTMAMSCIAHFLDNQRGMLIGDDAEYLHQMRVALRRLRSVFAVFAPLFPEAVLAPQVAEIRWLAGALGPARDWDVFDTETLPRLTARYQQHRGVLAFRRATTRLRGNAQRVARRAVASARGQGLMLSLGGWLAAESWQTEIDEAQRIALGQPVSAYARTVLAAAQSRVLKRGRQFNTLTPPELHRLRIAAKKLRYAIDFFTTLYPQRRTESFRNTLAQLQEVLGAFNDAVVTTQLVMRAGRDLRGTGIHEARGILIGWSAGMQDGGTRQLQNLWKQFRGAKPFWN